MISCGACVSAQSMETPEIIEIAQPTETVQSTKMPELAPKESNLGNGHLIKIAADNQQERIAVLSSTGIGVYNLDNTFVEFPNSNALDMDWSPKSDKIAIGTRDGEIIIWDVTTGITNQFSKSSDNPIRAIKWSNDGARIAAGDNEGLIIVLEVNSGNQLVKLDIGDMFLKTSSIEWSGDDRYLFAADALNADLLSGQIFHSTLYIWETERWFQIGKVQREIGIITDLDWSSAQKTLAIAHRDGMVTFWSESEDHNNSIIDTNTAINSLAWSQDGELIVAGGEGGKIEVWGIDNNTLIAENEAHANWIVSVDWLGPDSRIVSAGFDDGYIKFWDVDDWQLDSEITRYYSWFSNVVWSSSGNYIAVAKYGGDIVFWNTKDQSLEFTISTHFREWLFRFSLSPNEKYMVVDTWEDWVQLWDLEQKVLIHEFQAVDSYITDIDWSSDNSSFIISGESGSISIWDTAANNILEVESGLPVSEIAWADQDAFVIIGANDGDVYGFDLESEEVIFSDFCSDGFIWSMEISPDGKTVLVICRDRSVKGWDIQNEFELIFEFQGENTESVSWSPDGDFFAIAGENSYFGIWDQNFNKVIENPTDEDGSTLLSVSWSPDSSQLVTLGSDDVITIWDFSE